jgi:hypothetical protein
MNPPTESNSLKRRALEAFARYGALNPPAWAVLVGMRPVRSSYSYLLRLHRFGLLSRNRDGRGFLTYCLSERGQSRLKWLQSHQPPQPHNGVN